MIIRREQEAINGNHHYSHPGRLYTRAHSRCDVNASDPPVIDSEKKWVSTKVELTAASLGTSWNFLTAASYLTLLRVVSQIFGSGSLGQNSPLLGVAMKKEEQTSLVYAHRLGKRRRHVHQTCQGLAPLVIPALHYQCQVASQSSPTWHLSARWEGKHVNPAWSLLYTALLVSWISSVHK